MTKYMSQLLFLLLIVVVARSLRAQDLGIFVGEPKIYDDQALALMLNAATAQLTTLRPIDQTTLIGHIGAAQGASLSQSGFALQVNGLPSVGNVTTTASGTPSTVQTLGTTTTTAAGATTSGTTTTNQTTTPSSTVQNVATQPSVAASAPSAPAPSTSLPSAYSISAMDTLNEQMQLTYEIANLQLLLQGSLTDRFVTGTRLLKHRTTVGFPISITPPAEKRFRNAVAEVDVIVRNGPGMMTPEQGPGLVTILPREKTYNVANITDRSVSIGGGVVTQVASVGATWLWGHKTYYLVQDQDTVALQRQSPAGQTEFAWQFRPVLGRQFVRSGLRQTFVQLAFPTGISRCSRLGDIAITVRWRKYDSKNGSVGAEIASSTAQRYPLEYFDMTPQADSVTIEDVGAGMITISAAGGFLPGTSVRIGAVTLNDSVSNFALTPSGLRFTIPAILAATNPPMLVSRDGTEQELLQNDAAVGNPPQGLATCADQTTPPVAENQPSSVSRSVANPTTVNTPMVTTTEPIAPKVDWERCPQADADLPSAKQVEICRVVVRPYSDTESEVTVNLEKIPKDPARHNPLVALIGGKLFGLSDSPFLSGEPSSLRFVAPSDLIKSNRVVIVKRLFWGPNFSAQAKLPMAPGRSITKINLLSAGDDTVFAISGTGVDQIRVLIPSIGVRLTPIALPGMSGAVDTTTMLMHVESAQLKGLKQFTLQVGDQPPVILAVPDDAKPPDSKPVLKPQDPIPPGTGESLTIRGTGLDKVKRIKYLKATLSFRLALDKQSLTLDLPPEITSTEGVRYLDVLFTDGSSARYEIDVKQKK